MSPSATVTTPARPARQAKMDMIAGRLAALGATLGVLAGVMDVTVGSSIRDWIGNKLDPTPLGLATIMLSGAALAGAVAWQRPGGRDGGRRLATILAFLLPAGIGFTTIGRLWYVPGVLLLAAALLVAGAGTREQLTRAVNRDHWLTALTALLGAYYLFLGGDALPKTAGWLGILGALAIWAALTTAGSSHRAALTLLIGGALPFAIVTWWSVITPLIAILVLAIGPPAIRSRRAARHPGQPKARAASGRQPAGALSR